MKIGVNFKIDVTKLDKARFFQGSKGTYCDLTAFIDLDNPNEYGDNGFITQSKKKEESKDIQLPIVGNSRVFWKDLAPTQQQQPPQEVDPDAGYVSLSESGEDDDIPF